MNIKNSVNNIGSARGAQDAPARSITDKQPAGEGFDSVLKGQLGSLQQKSVQPNVTGSVKFSAHAIERMRSRGIALNPQTLQRLEEAVQKAADKGARESLMLTDDAALIVSVKNKTVITAMDRETMKENVFTNIDSTVIL